MVSPAVSSCVFKSLPDKGRGVNRAGSEEGNRLSVQMELQADCLAGIWAHHADRARQILEEGDIEEALNAASAIGDDRLQRQARGHVTPESFTHGTSARPPVPESLPMRVTQQEISGMIGADVRLFFSHRAARP